MHFYVAMGERLCVLQHALVHCVIRVGVWPRGRNGVSICMVVPMALYEYYAKERIMKMLKLRWFTGLEMVSSL